MIDDPTDDYDQNPAEYRDLSEDTLELSLDITIDEDFDPYPSDSEFDDPTHDVQSYDLSEITVETPIPECIDRDLDQFSEDDLFDEEADLTSEVDD